MIKRLFYLSLIIFIVLILLPNSIGAFWDWEMLESDNFVLFYPRNYDQQAEETLYYLEKYREDVFELVGNERDIKIYVTLEDLGLFTNGYANPIFNKIGLFTNNPNSFSTLANYESWLRLVGIHELTHIAQMGNFSTPPINKFIFGNIISPNIHSPLWLIEGIAVYNESRTSPYEGRLNGGYYDGVLTRVAQADKLPSLGEITYSHDFFPGGQQYLYGAAFLRYLANSYGEERFAELFRLYGSYFWTPFMGNILPTIGLDKAAIEVYGKNFQQLYADWQEYELKKHQDLKFEGELVLTTDKGYINNLIYHNDKLYYFKSKRYSSYPFSYHFKNQLMEYDITTGKERILKETIAANVASIKIVDNNLYYALGEITGGYPNSNLLSQGIIANLYSYDLKSGVSTKLLCAELTDFVVLETGEIIYAQANKQEYGSELFIYKDGVIEKLGTIEELISEMILYQDRLIVVSKGSLSTWGISYLDYSTLELEGILLSPFSEKQINIIDDILYYTANYEGYKAIYQYDLKTDNLRQVTSETYATNGFIVDEYTYFLRYDLEGMAIYRHQTQDIQYNLPEFATHRTAEIDFSNLDITLKEGDAFVKNLSYLTKPGNRVFPFFFSAEDALGLNYYQINLLGGFNIGYTNRMFMPLTISIASMSGFEGRINQLNLSYPLYQSNLDGLTNIHLDLSTDFNSISSGIKMNFNYPNYNLSLALKNKLASKDYYKEVTYNYLLDNARLTLQGKCFSNFYFQQDMREIQLKNYNQGKQLSIEYTSKLWEIRQGLWNPNIFLADIYGKAFIDYYLQSDNNLAYGYEFLFEIGTANWLHLVPKIGLTVSQDERRPYFALETNF